MFANVSNHDGLKLKWKSIEENLTPYMQYPTAQRDNLLTMPSLTNSLSFEHLACILSLESPLNYLTTANYFHQLG